METKAKLYTLSLHDVKTYIFAALFVIGNIALPTLSPRTTGRTYVAAYILLHTSRGIQVRH